jgi:hypothetical protein
MLRLARNRNLVNLVWFVSYETSDAETHTANCYYGAVEIEVRGDPLVMVIAIAKTAGVIPPRR